MESRHIEIMDTTLRDGEQTSGVSFMPHEKLMIARALLQDLNVDRIEVASARFGRREGGGKKHNTLGKPNRSARQGRGPRFC